ncbi:hypothetical protein ACFLTB_04495 [Chloroflexota bacterium]
MDKQERGKHIISIAKNLKAVQKADARIASFLYATSDAGRLGLFISSIKSEGKADISRIRFLAAQEGFGFSELVTQLLPWLEKAGLCLLERDSDGEITSISSLVLAYTDLLSAVSDYYFSLEPSDEDKACITIQDKVTKLPIPESVIRQEVAREFSEEIAHTAIQLLKAYKIVSISGEGNDPVLYAPKVWATLHPKASAALSPLDRTDREVLLYLVNRVRENQGYPETLLFKEAEENNVKHLLLMSIGIGLIDRTELYVSDGSKRIFLTTPHFYSDLADEFGEDMCDRVKIFLDSIRNGQYFGSVFTGRILDPEVLLRALINRGKIGPASAISTDYIIAEKAGIIKVQRPETGTRAYMEIGQEDTVKKVLEIVSSGDIEPGAQRMKVDDISSGISFNSIEQARMNFDTSQEEMIELENEIIKRLRE